MNATKEDIAKAKEIEKEYGIDVDKLDEQKQDPEWVKRKVLSLVAGFMNTCYAIGDGHYRESTPRMLNDSHEETMRHLYGKRQVLLALIKELDPQKELLEMLK